MRGGTSESGRGAQPFEHAVERVQAAVVDHQPALAATAVDHADPGAERFGQFGFQRGDVGLLPCLAGAGLLRRRRQLAGGELLRAVRSEEHTSELQSLMRISYAVFCLKK